MPRCIPDLSRNVKKRKPETWSGNEMKAEAKGRDQDWKHKMGEILFLVEEMRKERKRDEDRRDGARNGWLRRRKCC